MKDIRFWRAEYPEDIIGCDQSNRGSKINAWALVEDETQICAPKPFSRSEIEATLGPVGGALVVLQYTTGESSGVGAASLVVNPGLWLTAPPPLQSADQPKECSEKERKQQ